MRLTFIFLLLILVSNGSYAQSLILNGKIVDTKGIPVPFASVYEKNTTSGTSANSDGEFQLKLKPGKHSIIFKAIGYSQESRELYLKSDQFISVILNETVYE